MEQRTCLALECERAPEVRGMCKTHYNRSLKSDRAASVCPECGSAFTARKGNRQVYCSTDCRHTAWRRERGADRRCDLPDCDRPHEAFGLCKVHYNQTKRITRVTPIHFPTCLQCGALFTAKREGQRYCSSSCAYRASTPAVCRTCGQPREKWCELCTDCRDRARVAARRAGKQARRATIKGADAERINAGDIYDRDGWRCGICRRKVNPKLRYPNPRSASLDHIVPLTHGGTHTRTNVQCAHLNCNVKKSNREIGQELLVG